MTDRHFPVPCFPHSEEEKYLYSELIEPIGSGLPTA